METLRSSDAAACALAGALAVLLAIEARTREGAAGVARAPAEAPRRVEPERDREDLGAWSARELRGLPGIGELRANAIVRARHAGEIGGSVRSLAHVHGIGEATVEAIRESLGGVEARRPEPGDGDGGDQPP